MGPRSSPVLFDLLDSMDGAAADADLLFLLTTNRADLLEPALAARPGRVDVAVEIDLPDAPARERLLTLYGKGVPLQLTAADVQTAVERTDGTTASFLRELIRRSVLEALQPWPSRSPAPRRAHLVHRPAPRARLRRRVPAVRHQQGTAVPYGLVAEYQPRCPGALIGRRGGLAASPC